MMAAGLGHQAALLRPILQDRMRVDPNSLGGDGKPGVMVIDPYGGTTRMRVNDLLDEMKNDHELRPLFNKAESGRKGSGSGNGAPAGPNPFRKGADYNVTEQARLIKRDPAKAERLRLEAIEGALR